MPVVALTPQKDVSWQRCSHGETRRAPVPGLAHGQTHISESALGFIEREERRLDLGTACLCQVPLRIVDRDYVCFADVQTEASERQSDLMKVTRQLVGKAAVCHPAV